MQQKSRVSRWVRRILILLTVCWVLITALIVLGTLVPAIPVLGAIGTLLTSFVTLHIIVAALVGLVLSWAVIRLGGQRIGRAAAAVAIASALGGLIPLVAITRAASDYRTDLSWADHWSVAAPTSMKGPDQTVRFADFGTVILELDIYRPSDGSPGLSTPVVMMHGGGFTAGNKSDGKDWDRWLADRGYTVFDVEYRLEPQPTWQIAAGDVACAMTWIAARAAEYGVDPSKLVSAGQSAGAALALQVAYGDGNGPIVSSCGGAVPKVAAVLAFYPPEDMVLAWELNPMIGPVGARSLSETYTGGTPKEFPDRYRAVSPSQQVRQGLPPTFISYGEHDHLVPPIGHIQLRDRLQQAGVPSTLVAVPYSDHAYDVLWGSLGGQITRQAVGEFLEEYVPSRQSAINRSSSP
jgi:acetyl esterase/lipase